MKRSEMIELITESVLKSEHLYHLGRIKAKSFAEEILKTIEEADMAPPKQWREIKRDWGAYSVDGDRRWEREDKGLKRIAL